MTRASSFGPGPLAYKRDYFLCLPTPDLRGTIGKRALYSDAAGFSRALFASLEASGAYGGTRILRKEALLFWTEHSDRAGLDSHLAALGVSSDLRRFVGRWAAQGSEDHYVRTAVRVVENLQRYAADHARVAYQGGADYFGEEHLLEQLRSFLREQGVEHDIQEQLDKLQVADQEADNAPRGVLTDGGTWQRPEVPEASASSVVVSVAEGDDLEAAVAEAEEPAVDEVEALVDLGSALADQEAEERAARAGGLHRGHLTARPL